MQEFTTDLGWLYRKPEARRLAKELATLMSLNVIEESSTQKKFN